MKILAVFDTSHVAMVPRAPRNFLPLGTVDTPSFHRPSFALWLFNIYIIYLWKKAHLEMNYRAFTMIYLLRIWWFSRFGQMTRGKPTAPAGLAVSQANDELLLFLFHLWGICRGPQEVTLKWFHLTRVWRGRYFNKFYNSYYFDGEIPDSVFPHLPGEGC